MISKDLIKLLIAEYQREVKNKTLIERPYRIEDTLNYVFVGLRRAGKLTFKHLFQPLHTTVASHINLHRDH